MNASDHLFFGDTSILDQYHSILGIGGSCLFGLLPSPDSTPQFQLSSRFPWPRGSPLGVFCHDTVVSSGGNPQNLPLTFKDGEDFGCRHIHALNIGRENASVHHKPNLSALPSKFGFSFNESLATNLLTSSTKSFIEYRTMETTSTPGPNSVSP